MQKLGQHFLKNTAALEKIVDTLALANGDRVIEIGPGHGELTTPLARAAHNKRCEIFCIEKDHSLIGELELFAATENSGGEVTRINIVEGDALKLLPSLALPGCKIVGNIPYYITGKLLRVVSELEHKPERVVLLIQKEVAERICAAPPEMNRLAASVQFWADAKIITTVPRKYFSPPPEVDSAVIVLTSKNMESSVMAEQYYRAVRIIFAQPRKTLLNNLSELADGAAAKHAIAAQIEKLGIDPGSRPQNLGIDQIAALASAKMWG